MKNPLTIEYKRAREASPIFHVSADDPPFLLVHGDKDVIVPIAMSESMYEKLQEMDIASKLIRIEGAGHGPGFPGAINPPDLNKEYVQWMDTHLIDR